MIWFEYHYGDLFGTPETAERTYYYHVTYHPHARFDGSRYIAGAPSCTVATENYRAAIQSRLDETGGSPVEISGGCALSPGLASVNTVFRMVDGWTFSDLRATIIVYEDNVYWCCGAFDQDTWQRVTRVISDHPVTLQKAGDVAYVSAEIPLDPTWNPEQLHFVAFLQDVPSKEIVQGKVLPAAPAGLADGEVEGLRWLEVAPNPSRGEVALRFDVAGAGSSVARLAIVDALGRRVAEAPPFAPGTHEWRWNAVDAEGARLASGVYFVRLEQGERVRTTRLVLTH
jgi:hypothetical protein